MLPLNMALTLSRFIQQLQPVITFFGASSNINDTKTWNTLNAFWGGIWLNIDLKVGVNVGSAIANKSEDDIEKKTLVIAWWFAKIDKTFGDNLSHQFLEISNLGPYNNWGIYVIIILQNPN